MKTKSYLFAAASATLLLAGCTQDEVVSVPSSRAIAFGTYVSNTSRAPETDPAAETPAPGPEAAPETNVNFLADIEGGTGNGFYVFGVYDSEAKEVNPLVTVFDGVSENSHVINNTASSGRITWGYEPINYWNVGKYYKFAAYGPAVAKDYGSYSFDYSTNTLSIKGYKAGQGTTTKETTVTDNRVDLVVAEGDPAGYKLADANASLPVVNFKFFHALSKVRFTFVNGWRNTVDLQISEVSLGQVYSMGDLVTTGSLSDAKVKIPFDSWTTEGYERNETYRWNKHFVSADFEEEGVYENFYIPQTLADDIVLTFTVKVTNSAGSGPDLGGEVAQNQVTKSVKIPIDVIDKWEPGKYYNYTLLVDGEFFGLKPIQFTTVEVEDWGDPTVGTLDKTHIVGE